MEDWCKTCEKPRRIVDDSIEWTIDGPNHEIGYHVITLSCGHELISKSVRNRLSF